MHFKCHASRLLGVMRFPWQKASYVTKANANDLCFMHHGLDYDKLCAIDLNQQMIASNNDQFRATTIVVEEIIRLQSN